MTESIHAALWEWFAQCQTITRRFFNFSSANDEDTVIATAGDTLLEEYIDGSQRRRYAFEISHFCPITFEQNSTGNIDMLEEAQAVAHWVNEQTADGNLPQLPAGYTAESIDVLDEYAGYATAVNVNIAKYMIPMAMTYTKG